MPKGRFYPPVIPRMFYKGFSCQTRIPKKLHYTIHGNMPIATTTSLAKPISLMQPKRHLVNLWIRT
jgi:hypothetical protein